ncbi:unnamed protein product, partial [Mesorhabditis spiculigera]
MASKLLWAVENGDLDVVRENVNRKNVDEVVKAGRNSMHMACDYGQVEVVKYLIENGGNVNLADKHGITPLLYAIWENHIEVAKLLMAKGANRNVKSPLNEPLLDCATSDEMKDLLRNYIA